MMKRFDHFTPGTGGMFILLGLFIFGALLGNMLIIALQTFAPAFANDYGTIVSYPIMFLPAMLYAALRSRADRHSVAACPTDSPRFGGHSAWTVALVTGGATVALAFLSDGITALMPQMPEQMKLALEKILDAPLWVTLLSVSVFAPFFEEWLCRGMILRGLLTKMSPFAAITISAAFFAVIHLNPWQAVPAFILGLLFGYVYYTTGSLKMTMLMHCINNTMAALFSRIPRFEEAESFLDLLSPATYIGIALCCITFIAGAVIFLSGIRRKEI